jgi:hypothetical protein
MVAVSLMAVAVLVLAGGLAEDELLGLSLVD